MSHVMIDLETLSLGKDAAIVSIAAVQFEPERGIIVDTFYRTVSAKSAQRGGGSIDASTVMWWIEQGSDAKKELFSGDAVLIEVALKDFANWLRAFSLEGIWGNGADFDNVILESAYQRLGLTAPWSYKMNRCYRTLKELYPEVKWTRPTIAHHALEDAKAQTQHLCEIWKKLYAK